MSRRKIHFKIFDAAAWIMATALICVPVWLMFIAL